MDQRPLTVAWCSYFPVEWLPNAPDVIKALPKHHPATWLQVLVQEFKTRKDLRLHIIELRKGLDQDISFEDEGVTFHCLKVPGGVRAPSLFWVDTLLIRRKLRAVQPDVLHAWGTEKGAALAASRLPYPYLVSLQGLMEYFSTILPVNRYERVAAWFERISLRRAKVASGESTFVVDWLRGHYPHLRLHHVEHAPGWAYYRLERKPSSKPIEFVAVGALSYRKGTDLILEALDKLVGEIDFRLTLIGFAAQMDLLETIKARTSSALWERVTILHTAPSEEVLAQLSRATMVLFPTRGDTGPVAVKEAAVAGIPVIGSIMGGIPDYVTAGRNGLLFAPGHLDGLIEAIRKACAHPLFSRGLVDQETLKQVRDHLSPSRMAEGFMQAYRELAAGTQGAQRVS